MIEKEKDGAVSVPHSGDETVGKVGITTEINQEEPPSPIDPNSNKGDVDSENVIIITGADAATHLLPMRDDFDRSLTFRSLFLSSILAGFQAVMSQIYTVSS